MGELAAAQRGRARAGRGDSGRGPGRPALTSARPRPAAGRGEGPPRRLQAPVAKPILSARRAGGGNPQTTSPRLTTIPVLFFPIIQKLEFDSRFHVPNYIFTDLGQEKTERSESFYSAFFFFF